MLSYMCIYTILSMLIGKQYGQPLLYLTKSSKPKFACEQPRGKLVIIGPVACS